MAGKKPLSAAQVHKHLQKRAKKKAAGEKRRARHYSRGDRLLKKVSGTLKKIAATHPSPSSRKQAKLALKQLNDAHTAFGDACMCQGSGPTFNGDT